MTIGFMQVSKQFSGEDISHSTQHLLWRGITKTATGAFVLLSPTYNKESILAFELPPDHLLLDSAPNLGPLISLGN
jgi:hypothetical protein